jgi:hypothetical protein
MILRFFLDIVNGQEAQLVPLNEIKYHRSCYKAYTSKINLQRFVSDVPECSNTSNDASKRFLVLKKVMVQNV